MAFTATLRKNAIAGNQRVCEYLVTADAASGMVATPLGYVESLAIGPVSMGTAAGKFKANLNDSSATANGTVFISSIANGDVFFLTVYGRS
jgi:hypothetical protein